MKSEQIDLRKLAPGESLQIDVTDETATWCAELLRLAQEGQDREANYEDPEQFFRFKGELIHRKHPQYNRAFVLSGDIHVKYRTVCVNSLEPMTDVLDCPIDSCFVDDHLAQESELADEIEISVGENMYDLYFYKDGKLDLKQTLWDLFTLNQNPLPKTKEFDETKYWQD